MDTLICRFLRVPLMGKAYGVSARRSWTNEEVLRQWRVALMRRIRSETDCVAANNVEGHEDDLGRNDGRVAAGQQRSLEARCASMRQNVQVDLSSLSACQARRLSFRGLESEAGENCVKLETQL